MEDIRRFLHTLYGLFEKGTRIRGILGCFLGGLFLNIVIELMDRQSLSAVLVLRIAPAGVFGKRADFDVFSFAVPVFQAAVVFRHFDRHGVAWTRHCEFICAQLPRFAAFRH